MSGYFIRLLQPDDVDAVLQFELANRTFFEKSIETRPAEFYQPDAVQQHIAGFLLLKQLALAWPAVIFNTEHQLIGRANLTDIDTVSQSAYVGYRIAEHDSGRGVASFALSCLIQQARQMGLALLFAFVSTENHASMQVLKKAGFQPLEVLPHVALVRGQRLSGYLMWLKL